MSAEKKFSKKNQVIKLIIQPAGESIEFGNFIDEVINFKTNEHKKGHLDDLDLTSVLEAALCLLMMIKKANSNTKYNAEYY